MTDTHTVGGLKWVKGKISASLQHVRDSLEAFTDENAEAGDDLGETITALHEIRGVLVAFQITGPARLVEEMQQHCESLAYGQIPQTGEAREALMLALIQLPDYLDRLESGQEDLPLALLPSINDLRCSRGEDPLSEAELLVPPSVLADTELPSTEMQQALARVSAKIRPHFHRYLLQWYKPQTAQEGLGNLGRLFHQLQRFIQGGIFHELFLAAEAVVEAIREGSIVSGVTTKALIGNLDRVIKPFSESKSAWPESEAQGLLMELMALIARCESSAYLVTELRQAYGLQTEDDDDLPVLGTGLSPDAVLVLISEARKELIPVKDALDLYARGGCEDRARVAELEPLVRNLGSTLAVTGRDDLVARLGHCADDIGAIARDDSPVEEGRLMFVAEELLSLEAALEALRRERKAGLKTDDASKRHRAASALEEANLEMAEDEQAVRALSESAYCDETFEVRGETVDPAPPLEPLEPTLAGRGIDLELLEIFIEEAEEEEQTIREQFGRWRRDDGDEMALTTLRRSFHTLKGSGRLVGAEVVGELARAVENLLNKVIDHGLRVTPEILTCVGDAVALLPDLIASEPEGRPPDLGGAIERIDQLAEAQPAPALAESIEAGPQASDQVIPWPSSDRSIKPADAEEAALADVDRELLDIIRTESAGHIGVLDAFLETAKPGHALPDEPLVNALHRLSGSARVTGIDSVAAVAGGLERLFQNCRVEGRDADSGLLNLLTQAVRGFRLRFDRLPGGGEEIAALFELADEVKSYAPGTAAAIEEPPEVPERSAMPGQTLREAIGEEVWPAVAAERQAPEAEAAAAEEERERLLDVAVEMPATLPISAPARVPPPDRPAVAAAPGATDAPAAGGETATPIGVRADLLNRLINNAGEISIYRSRLAQNNNVLGFRLEDLDQSIVRLREQLRQLEIETEAQIIHRFERDEEVRNARSGEEFASLELDRFSTMQRLSRSLAETVNDLGSLREILGDLHSQSDTLLSQQGRIADDLQDGLLRTRMVPFAQIVPRLHRVVRLTAQQLGKQVRLETLGPEVELDRTIQERIVAPLEHLLRNAVAHGIEPTSAREAAGKDAVGSVVLSIRRQGKDVVISVSDDGAGLDLAAVRARAVERGLLKDDAEVGDDEAAQLIMDSGFTRAVEVNQIAGRGFGLDVVNSEIEQLDGTLALETDAGKGTRFTVRLPLTLSLVDAMLVQIGDEVCAIPHATMEAAARISRDDLEATYAGTPKPLRYAGNEYPVMYLGSLLQIGEGSGRESVGMPDLGERSSLPVILARAGERRIAFHIDGLLGSERIVVKPLGPALSSVRWLSRGTVLSDGRVAMIVDLLGLLHSGLVDDYRPPTKSAEVGAAGRTCVMIVDDSVTVRRVTRRMLQRQGMDVMTAKDGVDALDQLEERIPDLILLDIEMPRMDGYEFTRHIRRSPRLKDIPLIMITSCTGERHREYAEDLGVDRYLDKPFQEAELVDEISALLSESGS
jgi:chemotaxis protein histidine kinase CheA/CheY-like chemotaxis protein